MANKLHIISFDIPLPANYGGVIDVYYKLKSLHQAGFEITLHCFTSKSRHEVEALNTLCKKVYYYPRRTGWQGLSPSLPYIISSRKSEELLQNLRSDDHPILFEGIHTTYFAKHPDLKNRCKILRAHNIEHQYYQHLFRKEKHVLRKIYFGLESLLLKKYEADLSAFDLILPISEREMIFFKKRHNNVSWLPAFHPFNKVESEEGKGEYCLYHGNLSVSENEDAANFLIKEVFSKIKIPFIIAGKNPSSKLLSLANSHIRVVANPDQHQMEDLIRKAHIHVLPSCQTSGVKLKLLHALYAGRFCITNQEMLDGSGVKSSVILANSAGEFLDQIETHMTLRFNTKDIQERNAAMSGVSLQQSVLINFLASQQN